MDNFEDRTRRCQRRLDEARRGGVVLFPSQNLYYLGGFHEEPSERHLFLFVPSEGEPAFVAPELYGEQIRDETWVEDLRLWADGDDPVEPAGETASDLGMASGELLVDATMWARFTQDLRGRSRTPSGGWPTRCSVRCACARTPRNSTRSGAPARWPTPRCVTSENSETTRWG